ncbi:MAG: lysozyme inhibitor LprI family protein [Sulfitobacter sp.]|nr:lysozyme inhibitor LprI family protein [Sulfitobacter sp.]
MKWMIAVALLGAAPLSAQVVEESYVRNCFASAGPGETAPICLGEAANQCQSAGFDTTIGISQCIQAETAVWDTLLNETYGEVRRIFTAQDPSLGTNLRDAQRAWIAYRDAECGLEYARWIGGSIRTIVAANCHMTETAERAIELRDKKEY